MLLGLALLTSISAVISACDAAPSARTCSTASDCPRGQQCLDRVCRPSSATTDAGTSDAPSSDPTRVTSIRVEPETSTLEASGSEVTQALTVFAVQADGVERAVPGALFVLGAGPVGRMDGATFRSPGTVGGRAIVSVTLAIGGDVFRANATIVVSVTRSEIGTGVPDDIAARFAAATTDADPALVPNVLHPLAGAVMPLNVATPSVQWTPFAAVAGEVVRVRMTRPHANVTAYVAAADPFDHSLLLGRDAWRTMAESDAGEPIVVEVDRLVPREGGDALSGSSPLTFRTMRGSLFGKVYFWDLNQGRTETIDPVAGARDVTVPAPAAAPSGSRCVACHTVSRDGRWLYGRREDGAAMQFDLTSSLAGDPSPMRHAPSFTRMLAGTFDPTSSMLVGMADSWAGPMVVVDAATGADLGIAGLPNPVSFPSWSPMGGTIAFAGNAAVHPSDGHPIDGDVFVMPRTSESPLAFGAPTMLHDGASLAGAPEGGTCDTHPVWSPDEQRLVFQHGPRAFSFVPGSTDVPSGALYAMQPDGANLVRLDNFAGGPTAASAYFPTFAPYITNEADGHRYYWVAFYSRRDYGNDRAGARGLRQLWVGAIDADAAAGDPSFVPYWLPGQDRTVHNIAAYWAPEPCRPTGVGCSTSSECCSDLCDPDADVCAPPPEEMCRRDGETCGSTEDCCGEAECVGNVCIGPPS